jgi:predicted amidohydrolase
VCFPEGYPGPFSEGYPGPYSGPLDAGGHLDRSPIALLQEAARWHGVYVSGGCLEPNAELDETFVITHKLIAPDGAILASYRRMQPNHPYFNAYLMGGRMHVLPGNEFVTVDTPLGRLDLVICSELFVPELARTLMLRGGDIIIAPGGGMHTRTHTRLAQTWR